MKQNPLSWLRSETERIVAAGSSRGSVDSLGHQAFQLTGLAAPFPGSEGATRIKANFRRAVFRPPRHSLGPGGGASFPGKILRLLCS